MRKAHSSSDGVRLLGPSRSPSVAGKGRRDRKSAFPLALPLLVHGDVKCWMRPASRKLSKGVSTCFAVGGLMR